MPNGMTFSGYACKNVENKTYNLILFREATSDDTYTFKLPDNIDGKNVEIIYQNSPMDINISGNSITIKFAEQRSFVWVRIK